MSTGYLTPIIQLPPGHFLYSSESVNEGHPDKLCDQISDAVVDACLAQDPNSKVACKSCTKTNLVMIFGEITTSAVVNYQEVVRNTLRQIGYDSDEKGIDCNNCEVKVVLEQQDSEIADAVHRNKAIEDIGAGDQGLMFGYATNETPECMPLSHKLATHLGIRLRDLRKNGTLTWLRPDGKTQVTVEYRKEGGLVIPVRVHTILISTQHEPWVTNEQIRSDLMNHVIIPVVPAQYLDERTIYHLNPSNSFTSGGPKGDAGLTGRKIIIDTYGGWGHHGGGAFSGKDPTKVDRSAAYAARWIAKSLVKGGFCDRVNIQVSYSIGIAYPLSVTLDSYGTAKDGKTDEDLLHIVLKNFDLRPGCIIRDLRLNRPIYQKTASYGHFGREGDSDFSWEIPKDLSHEK
ncbi:unnamed protein product [Blepharisma stoltei]|uniref:S-adenosylmethionine synthase n=1 Tax=Blepharisma stoltei TaxID=1481888 RepID=A0AAU9K8T6_9CILI|nr:unnamed protein product [Blepharisma stoltei]